MRYDRDGDRDSDPNVDRDGDRDGGRVGVEDDVRVATPRVQAYRFDPFALDKLLGEYVLWFRRLADGHTYTTTKADR